MKKKLFGLVLVLGLVFSMSVSIMASQEYECTYVEQLRETVLSLISQRQDQEAASFDSRCDDAAGFDVELIRYRGVQLMYMFMDAKSILNSTRGLDSEVITVISAFATPCIFHDGFMVAFVDEKYLDLLDIVVEFTGIPPEAVVSTNIWGPFSFCPLFGQPFEAEIYDEAEDIAEHQNISPLSTAIPMGTRLIFRNPGPQSVQRYFGSMGHPRNGFGRSAFGTNHGRVEIGARVYRLAQPNIVIGRVVDVAFNPSAGLDVSYIVLESGFHVSTQAGAHHLILFFSNPSSTPNLDSLMLGGVSRNASGPVIHASHPVTINNMVFNNMIITETANDEGDSGAALVQGHVAIGTHVAGNRVNIAFHSQSPRYQHLRQWYFWRGLEEYPEYYDEKLLYEGN